MKPTVSRNRLFRTNYHQINSPITSDHPICSNWQESFPKKWKFDELYHSTASGDKYYWHLSWRSWHCSPNIYHTGCSHYYFVCQKKTNSECRLEDTHELDNESAAASYICLNESLTPEIWRLLENARIESKKRNYSFIRYTIDKKVRVKKLEWSDPVITTCSIDVQKIQW